ncbi:hypothetical protein PCO86_12295 [Pectobacteriaceae bacterium CE70]|nr:hypothetical protein [Serratia sp. ATCC 39006]WJV64858.1 hypothetical protein PCO87_10755 [Pectobacteriaceae bacterium C52]WJV69144.1 hypothetical protein PCO86_12295 [Pectobacteriaceae bacterium CE70]WJY13083.1 hypothetical protein PCO80_12165 [Pectobacteriaceae bacterium C80]
MTNVVIPGSKADGTMDIGMVLKTFPFFFFLINCWKPEKQKTRTKAGFAT